MNRALVIYILNKDQEMSYSLTKTLLGKKSLPFPLCISVVFVMTGVRILARRKTFSSLVERKMRRALEQKGRVGFDRQWMSVSAGPRVQRQAFCQVLPIDPSYYTPTFITHQMAHPLTGMPSFYFRRYLRTFNGKSDGHQRARV